MIKCDLQDLPKYSLLIDNPDSPKKKGRYHGSMFWDIPGYGIKNWVVAARIVTEEEIGNMPDQEVIESCLRYLNEPPPRKKYQKKKPRPKYGTLSLYRASLKREGGLGLISALLITSERKNKSFWGSGIIGK